MKIGNVFKGGLFGLLAGVVTVAITYLGHLAAGLPYIPFDIFDWLARVLPGRVVIASIEAMVAVIRGLRLGPTAATAKTAEMGMALIQFVGTWVIFGAALGLAGKKRPDRSARYGALGGLILFLSTAGVEWARGFSEASPAVSLPWIAIVLVGGGTLLGRALFAASPSADAAPEDVLSRRRFLRLVGTGSFLVVVTASGVSIASRRKNRGGPAPDEEEIARAAQTSGPAASPPPAELEKRPPPVPGTRPELTSNRDFYRIDIDLHPPRVDGTAWRLKIEGLVERPLELSLEDIRSKPKQIQALTLSCISNPVGGDLIGTSFWTGLPLKDLLGEAGLKDGVREISVESADGFYESVPLAEALDGRTLLAYEMNGEPLAAEHGFPLRILIPGHFGMKQPKWIVRMEAIGRQGRGFWVDRNWSGTARVRTTSVIDVAAVDRRVPDSGIVPVGGIAFAGDRGISRVEVQADDGPWEEAALRRPALGPLTWVQWRYDWRAATGRHVLRVRAFDGAGDLQVADEAPPYPDGATGIDRKSAGVPPPSLIPPGKS